MGQTCVVLIAGLRAPPITAIRSSSPSLSRSANAMRKKWPFGHDSGAGRSSDVCKSSLPAVVMKQDIGEQRRERRAAGSQIKIEVTIVVDIAKVQPHRQQDAIRCQSPSCRIAGTFRCRGSCISGDSRLLRSAQIARRNIFKLRNSSPRQTSPASRHYRSRRTTLRT